MRISDWSADVSSSDLAGGADTFDSAIRIPGFVAVDIVVLLAGVIDAVQGGGVGPRLRLADIVETVIGLEADLGIIHVDEAESVALDGDRKSVVVGKSGSVRVDLGVGCLIKKTQ